jgi:predicted ester cyclase
MTTAEQNRAAYERFCRDVLMQGQLDVIDELVDASVVSHAPFPGQAPGREGFKQAFAQFRAAFSDIQVTVLNMVAGDDRVVGHFSVSAVQRGEFMGIPATGKTIAYDEMVIVRFAVGKIVEHWSVADTLAMMQVLGVVAEVSPPGAHGQRPR